MGSAAVSNLLGWTSIACWLGAQLPQVLENARRQSCEGLALPFLCNWLLGDISNLVGCILTHQLPFQTWLATYFCTVDMMLFSQYFYYGAHTSARDVSPSLLEPDPGTPYAYTRRYSSERGHYRALSNAAAHVAFAAARAASVEESHARGAVRERGHSSALQHARHSADELHLVHGHRTERSDAEQEDEDADALALLADSFHSEGGRKRVVWSRERHGDGVGGAGGRGGSTSRTRARAPSLPPLAPVHPQLLPADAAPGDGDAAARGRPLQRQVVDSPVEDLEAEAEAAAGAGAGHARSRTASEAAGRRSSRASMRGAGLVFLGVWAFLGVGSFGGAGGGVSRTSGVSARGTVLWRDEWRVSPSSTTSLPLPASSSTDGGSGVLEEEDAGSLSGSINRPTYSFVDDISLLSLPADSPPPPSSERIIGRISAWTCTILYLTSRLPQIWKNFVRKSVDGLSMYLFVFAFLGNTFYVLSILASPNLDRPRAEATAFLRESVPYLLGSAGTLMFDVTIVIQSCVYRPRKPRTRARTPSRARAGSKPAARALPRPADVRRRSASCAAEEEEALLGARGG